MNRFLTYLIGLFFTISMAMAPYFIQNISNQRQWCIQSADLNQDGRSDIFVGGTAGLFVLTAGEELGDFPLLKIPADNFLTQGASLADMDGDGDLDLFVCDDDKENFIGLNNGDGSFALTENFMDFSTIPPSDGSGNYGSVFSDYDRVALDLSLVILSERINFLNIQNLVL